MSKLPKGHETCSDLAIALRKALDASEDDREESLKFLKEKRMKWEADVFKPILGPMGEAGRMLRSAANVFGSASKDYQAFSRNKVLKALEVYAEASKEEYKSKKT